MRTDTGEAVVCVIVHTATMLAKDAPAMNPFVLSDHDASCLPPFFSSASSNREPETPHTAPILIHHTLAFFLWVIAVGEEHAFVPRGFLVFADATGLLGIPVSFQPN